MKDELNNPQIYRLKDTGGKYYLAVLGERFGLYEAKPTVECTLLDQGQIEWKDGKPRAVTRLGIVRGDPDSLVPLSTFQPLPWYVRLWRWIKGLFK